MILFKFIFTLLHSYDVFLGRDVRVIHAFAMGQCDFKCKVSTHAASCLLYIFTCKMGVISIHLCCFMLSVKMYSKSEFKIQMFQGRTL